MRTLLVEDHEVFRIGLKAVLTNLASAIEFVEAEGVEQALTYRDGPTVDLVLLDLHLQGVQGLAALQAVHSAFEAPVVIVSGDDDPELIWQAIGNGACGYIPKKTDVDLLKLALGCVLAGGIHLPEEAVRWQQTRVCPAVPPRPKMGLSGRELEVLLLAVQGKCNKVIARDLRVSVSTVKSHLTAAFHTLGVQNRTEAAYEVARQQLGDAQAPRPHAR